MAHARLSPSSAHRWMRCAASLMEEEKRPNTSSFYADEGTAAHTLAEWTLRDTGHNAAAYFGRVIEVKNDGQVRKITVGNDMVGHVQTYVDRILEYADSHELEIECKVRMFVPGIAVEPDGAFSSGTQDARIIVIRDRELQVHDLKYGMGVKVYAEENEQLAMYAVMNIEELELVEEFDNVRIVIHQPRLNWLDEWVVPVERLKNFRENAIAAGSRAVLIADGKQEALPTDYNPGEKQCNFCRASSTCSKLKKKVISSVMDEVDDMTATEVMPRFEDAAKKETIELLAPDDLSESMKMVDLIDDWCRAVRTEVSRRLFAGVAVAGFKLVQGKRGSRSWTVEDEAEELLKAMRYKKEEMYSMKLISPTQAEKLIKKDSPRRWKQLTGLIIQRDGLPSVAPDSDKRPALVTKSPLDEVDNLEEGEDLV